MAELISVCSCSYKNFLSAFFIKWSPIPIAYMTGSRAKRPLRPKARTRLRLQSLPQTPRDEICSALWSRRALQMASRLTRDGRRATLMSTGRGRAAAGRGPACHPAGCTFWSTRCCCSKSNPVCDLSNKWNLKKNKMQH